MVCHCSLARQKNTTSVFVCSWFLSLSCHNQQKPFVSPARKALSPKCCHYVSVCGFRERQMMILFTKQALSEGAHMLGMLGAITMAAVCMARWKAGTGSDLIPSCLFSSTLSSLISSTVHPLNFYSLLLPFSLHVLKREACIFSTSYHLN